TARPARRRHTTDRAQPAGISPADARATVGPSFTPSMVPPGETIGLVQRLAPVLTASNHKPVIVECNAVSPPTAERIYHVIAPTGCPFVDAGIIGPPPRPKGKDSPRFCASGPEAKRFALLEDYGLDVRA